MMLARKLLIVCLAISFPAILLAQFEKGTNSLGVTANYNNRFSGVENQVNANGDTVETQRINRNGRLTVSYYRFVSDRTAIGIEVGYGRSFGSDPFNNDGEWTERTNTLNDFSISPQLRYHFPLSDRLFAFVNNELMFSMQHQMRKRPQGGEILESEIRRIVFGAEVRPGVLWMISDHWSLEGSVFAAGISAFAVAGDEESLAIERMQVNVFDTFSLGSVRLGLRFYF